jgi:hypothetical protein
MRDTSSVGRVHHVADHPPGGADTLGRRNSLSMAAGLIQVLLVAPSLARHPKAIERSRARSSPLIRFILYPCLICPL